MYRHILSILCPSAYLSSSLFLPEGCGVPSASVGGPAPATWLTPHSCLSLGWIWWGCWACKFLEIKIKSNVIHMFDRHPKIIICLPCATMHVSEHKAKELPWKSHIPVTENKLMTNLYGMNMIIAREMKKVEQSQVWKIGSYWEGGVWKGLVALIHGRQSRASVQSWRWNKDSEAVS